MIWTALLLLWLVAYIAWLRAPLHRRLAKLLGLEKRKP